MISPITDDTTCFATHDIAALEVLAIAVQHEWPTTLLFDYILILWDVWTTPSTCSM